MYIVIDISAWTLNVCMKCLTGWYRSIEMAKGISTITPCMCVLYGNESINTVYVKMGMNEYDVHEWVNDCSICLCVEM